MFIVCHEFSYMSDDSFCVYKKSHYVKIFIRYLLKEVVWGG